jgi:hypothetical protein
MNLLGILHESALAVSEGWQESLSLYHIALKKWYSWAPPQLEHFYLCSLEEMEIFLLRKLSSKKENPGELLFHCGIAQKGRNYCYWNPLALLEPGSGSECSPALRENDII